VVAVDQMPMVLKPALPLSMVVPPTGAPPESGSFFQF